MRRNLPFVYNLGYLVLFQRPIKTSIPYCAVPYCFSSWLCGISYIL